MMRSESDRAEIYSPPEVHILEIESEGLLCSSVEPGESEDMNPGLELFWFFLSDNLL